MTKRYSSGGLWASRLLGYGLTTMLLCVVCGSLVRAAPQAGGGATQQPRFADKRFGEEEQIRLRGEWFYGTRRAGLLPGQKLWALRLAGVEKTRQAIALMRTQQALGSGPAQNVWISKGPSPSTFGGWNFGNISGRIQAIAADWEGGILYVGAGSGGVWKSTNDGQSWTSIFDSAGSPRPRPEPPDHPARTGRNRAHSGIPTR